jgi:hypothetical protein
MRSVFAACLLLFQLQPILGTAACLGLIKQPTQARCEMPEQGTVPSQTLSESTPLSTTSCPIASLCAPTSPAIPGFAGLLESAIVLHTAPAIASLTLPLDIFSAPPFHPPKV